MARRHIVSLNPIINPKRLRKRVAPSPVASDRTAAMIDREIKECLIDADPQPRGIFAFYPCEVDRSRNRIVVETICFNSTFLTKRFCRAKEIGLFILTIGDGPEKRAQNAYGKNDGIKALIYDAIGSEYAESSADALHQWIEKEKGYPMARYSPGYNDWSISEQADLFKLIPGNEIGVRLTGSFVMKPEKSVSAMIGSCADQTEHCKDCKHPDCFYRRSDKDR